MVADIRIERKRDTGLPSLVALLVVVVTALAVCWLLAGHLA